MKGEEDETKNAYLHHRLRVKCAKAIIDNSPPLLHISNFARFSKLKDDTETLIARNRENTRILAALNRAVRTKGEIDSFRTSKNSYSPPYSKLQQRGFLLDEVDIENMFIGKKILYAKPELNTWLDDRFKRKKGKKQPAKFQYPSLVMSKYSHMDMPEDPSRLQLLFRPKIWLNLEVKGVRPLGQVVIVLHTEAAPQVVLEFVRLCFAKQKSRINFVRLFPRLWLEGDIPLSKDTLIRKSVEFDKRSLNHGQYAGVLSFSEKLLKNSMKPVFNFTLSFKPLSVCNGRRIGFGRICEGLRILSCIEDFGTKNGKPTKEIIVGDCGVL